jgi:HSP20 family protein
MRREIDELFGDAWPRSSLAARQHGGFRPRVDVYYRKDPPNAVVKADLSGVELDCVHLEIRGRTLTISGERRVREKDEGRVYQQVEIEQGPFRREIQLGMDVDAERARATYEDGILRIELPLREPAEPRTVPISGNGEEERSRD